MIHRVTHQSSLPWQVSRGDDDCSSVASKTSTNSLSSHFTQDTRDANQPQPHHGYCPSGIHDDESSFFVSNCISFYLFRSQLVNFPTYSLITCLSLIYDRLCHQPALPTTSALNRRVDTYLIQYP